MRLIEIPALTPNQLAALEELYRTTRDARLRMCPGEVFRENLLRLPPPFYNPQYEQASTLPHKILQKHFI